MAIITGLLIIGTCYATETGFKIEKQVNGDWKEAFIINYELTQTFITYPRAYLNTEAVFIAPRAQPMKPNHEYFGTILGAKFKLPTNAVLDLSTTAQYWWKGNSSGKPAGLEIGAQSASLTWSF